jgi:hypothetical protein
VCYLAAITRKALYEKERFLLRSLFSYRIDLLPLVSHVVCDISLLVRQLYGTIEVDYWLFVISW